jgi:hypothetical protein
MIGKGHGEPTPRLVSSLSWMRPLDDHIMPKNIHSNSEYMMKNALRTIYGLLLF